jgi:negative regulator of flagellin synthesis FlgM
MMINGIGSIDPIQPGKKTGRINQVQETAKTDTISLSTEALERSRLDRAMELVAAAPDVRAERVAELRAKINDPSYINGVLIEATADRLMEALGI